MGEREREREREREDRGEREEGVCGEGEKKKRGGIDKPGILGVED
jgi:hypothetical protein